MPPSEIKVNVDDWLKRNKTDPQRAREHVQEVAEQIQREADQRRLDELLEPHATECSACGNQQRAYKNDYICYPCRDKLDGTD